MKALLLLLASTAAWAGADSLGGVEGGAIGRLGGMVLAGLLGLGLGALAGGFMAHVLAGNVNTWTGRGALIGAALLAILLG